MWNISRNELILKLNDCGIGTSVHYIPVHMHSYYKKKYGYKDEQFPNSLKYYQSIITLPLYPLLTKKQILYIVDVLRELWENIKYYNLISMEIFSRTIALTFIFLLTPFFLIVSLLCIIFQGFPIFSDKRELGIVLNILKFISLEP